MKVYNSQQILEMEDLYKLQEDFCSFGIPFQYQMTDGEIGWYNFVKNRYCIADFIEKNSDGNFLLTFNDYEELVRVLKDDDCNYKAVMLSDNTALQRLFFWLSI